MSKSRHAFGGHASAPSYQRERRNAEAVMKREQKRWVECPCGKRVREAHPSCLMRAAAAERARDRAPAPAAAREGDAPLSGSGERVPDVIHHVEIARAIAAKPQSWRDRLLRLINKG